MIGRSRPLLKESKNRVHEKSICVSQSGVDDGRTRHEIHYDCPFLSNSYPDSNFAQWGKMKEMPLWYEKEGQSASREDRGVDY